MADDSQSIDPVSATLAIACAVAGPIVGTAIGYPMAQEAPFMMAGFVVGGAIALGIGVASTQRTRIWRALRRAWGRTDSEEEPLVASPRTADVRDPSSGSIRGEDVLTEPPPDAVGLSFPCAHCEAEIVVYYLQVGERAKCGECGERTAVPETATETNEPSTLSKAYGYGQTTPEELRALPRPADRPEVVDTLPQPAEGGDDDRKKLPRKTKQST